MLARTLGVMYVRRVSELSRFLEPRLDALVQQWLQRVAEDVAPAGLSKPVLRDHVAEVLRSLIASLDRGLLPETVVFAKEHGKQRYRVGFELTALVREYGLLRGLVLDMAARANLSRLLEEVRLVTDFISVAIIEGVAEYDACRRDEQGQREQLLMEARLLNDSALTAGAVGTFIWDVRTDRVYGNASFAQLFGIRLDSAGTAPIGDYLAAIHPSDRAATAAKIERALESGAAYEAEYRILNEGRERWVVARGHVDRDDRGRPIRFSGVLMDTNERKLAEEAQRALTSRLAKLYEQLQLSEDLYRTLFESIDQAFCLIDVLFDDEGKAFDYRYLQVNAAFEKQSGLREVVGKTIRELVPTIEPFWPELYGRVIATGESARVENPVLGMKRWFEVYACRVGPAERRQVVVLFSDITERKNIEQERERLLRLEVDARRIAEEASRVKDEFLATVSHELRTPLNAMLGWVQMLRSGAVEEDRKERALETIERNARSQAQLIEDLLDMSRILAGKLRLELEPLDVAGVVGMSLESIRPAASAKGIRLAAALDSIGAVSGDAHRLQQVVWNLLSNAVKFTPAGGDVKVMLRNLDSALEISVADTGQGIASDFLPHVFDRFRQAEGGAARAKGGLGLGLSIVRQIVEMHGGTIAASSEGPGRGAVFTVHLPLSSKGPRPSAGSLAVVPASTNRLSSNLELAGIRVLVVDDEEDAREVLAMMLRASGASVDQAASAEEARRAFTHQRPDVVVSDIGMPGETGYSLIESIRELSPDKGGKVPAIALTAYARSEDRTKALSAGFNTHVPKPVEAAELVAVVASLARSPG